MRRLAAYCGEKGRISMARKVIGPTGSRRRRWLFLFCLISTLGATAVFISGALGAAPEANPPGYMELDKDAVHNQTALHMGTLKSSASATDSSIVVCEYVGGPTPAAAGDTLLIDGEQLIVGAAAQTVSNKTGGCGFADSSLVASDVRTYPVSRGQHSTTAAAHAAGSDVTKIAAATPFAASDWDQVYQDVHANGGPTIATPNPCSLSPNVITNSVTCNYLNHQPGTSSFIGGGSKDPNTLSQWQWAATPVPDANQLDDGMAIKFQSNSISGGDQFLYFAADRFATQGSKDMGFWFFKDQVGLNTNGSFSGQHEVGDILLLGTFSQGGATTTIRVFKWQPFCTAANKSSDPSVDPTSCADTNLQTVGNFPDCVPGSSTDKGCNTVNSTTINSPWPYTGKSAAASNVIYNGGFMEGGIDLNALNLQGCFSSFMATTRSSPTTSSSSQDFILGNFQSCSTTLTTTPAAGADTSTTPPTYTPLTDHNSNSIPDITLSTAGRATVSDTASLTVNNASSFTGSLDFHLCGPFSDTTSNCAGTGGAAIGAASGTNPVTANGTYHSADATLTKAGRYCWRSNFTTTTPGVPNASDPPNTTPPSTSTTECFEVLPRTPTISTSATCSPTACNSGGTVDDTATLGNTANEPGTGGSGDGSINAAASTQKKAGGTITFKLYGPASTATCTNPDPNATPPVVGNLVLTSVVTISNSTTTGGDGTYNASDGVITGNGGSLALTTPGNYWWVASYSGDSPNTSGPVSGACADTGEESQIQKLQPTMDTAQNFVPNDSATVTVASGAGNLAGHVFFYMWVGDTTCGSGVLSTATYATASPGIDITTGTGTALSKTVTSANTTSYSTDGTTFSWIVKYVSDNSGHFSVTSACNNENSSITIDNGTQSNSS
jgi:hypothetical protein